jgi:hypothetical protein
MFFDSKLSAKAAKEKRVKMGELHDKAVAEVHTSARTLSPPYLYAD